MGFLNKIVYLNGFRLNESEEYFVFIRKQFVAISILGVLMSYRFRNTFCPHFFTVDF